jgi:hypothetical protein
MVEDLLQGYSKTFSTRPGQNLRMNLIISSLVDFTERLFVESYFPRFFFKTFVLEPVPVLDHEQYFLVSSDVFFGIYSEGVPHLRVVGLTMLSRRQVKSGHSRVICRIREHALPIKDDLIWRLCILLYSH